MKKYIVPVIAIAAMTSALTFWGLSKVNNKPYFVEHAGSDIPVHYASHSLSSANRPADFVTAANTSIKSVVHITTLTEARTVTQRSPFGGFGWVREIPAQMSSGSGVLISPDGYILTNNHVVQGADKVQVTFDDRHKQVAQVLGKDPETDLAVLKIEGNNYPFLSFGNSDSVQIGQWVLAVGYPLNLDITVTAGIVSGKSRSINTRGRTKNSIEAYIQTDAAVNQGNSGGPLINTNGDLIGINAAIASPTGSYAGYSYAIPSNIAKKVANDIIRHGEVQRGYLGIAMVSLNNLNIQAARQLGISKDDFENANGIFVSDVMEGSAAAKAGIKKGDFITAINGVPVNTSSEILEQVALYRPGNKIKVDYARSGKNYNTEVTLQGNAEIEAQTAKNDTQKAKKISDLGAQFQELTAAEAKELNIAGGVKVLSLEKDGILKTETNIKPGFVIFSLNDHQIKTVDDIQKHVAASPNRLKIAGLYPGQNGIYYYGINSSR